jgi:hypothetical protein
MPIRKEPNIPFLQTLKFQVEKSNESFNQSQNNCIQKKPSIFEHALRAHKHQQRDQALDHSVDSIARNQEILLLIANNDKSSEWVRENKADSLSDNSEENYKRREHETSPLVKKQEEHEEEAQSAVAEESGHVEDMLGVWVVAKCPVDPVEELVEAVGGYSVENACPE